MREAARQDKKSGGAVVLLLVCYGPSLSVSLPHCL